MHDLPIEPPVLSDAEWSELLRVSSMRGGGAELRAHLGSKPGKVIEALDEMDFSFPKIHDLTPPDLSKKAYEHLRARPDMRALVRILLEHEYIEQGKEPLSHFDLEGHLGKHTKFKVINTLKTLRNYGLVERVGFVDPINRGIRTWRATHDSVTLYRMGALDYVTVSARELLTPDDQLFEQLCALLACYNNTAQVHTISELDELLPRKAFPNGALQPLIRLSQLGLFDEPLGYVHVDGVIGPDRINIIPNYGARRFVAEA